MRVLRAPQRQRLVERGWCGLRSSLHRLVPVPSAVSLRQPTSPLGAMTTTTTFKGVDPNSRNSSR